MHNSPEHLLSRGLRFRGLRFRGLRFRGLRSVVCVFEVCVFETPYNYVTLKIESLPWSSYDFFAVVSSREKYQQKVVHCECSIPMIPIRTQCLNM